MNSGMVSEIIRSVCYIELLGRPYSKCSICPLPAYIHASAVRLIATLKRLQSPSIVRIV
jgi:hypothetical protein